MSSSDSDGVAEDIQEVSLGESEDPNGINVDEFAPHDPPTFRLSHISDTHIWDSRLNFRRSAKQLFAFPKRFQAFLHMKLFRGPRVFSLDLFRKAVSDIVDRGSDHVLHTGDLVNMCLPEEFRLVGAVLLRDELRGKGKVSCVPGNHDVYVATASVEWLRVFGETLVGVSCVHCSPFVERGGDLVEDIALPEKVGDVSEESEGEIPPIDLGGAGDDGGNEEEEEREETSPGEDASWARLGEMFPCIKVLNDGHVVLVLINSSRPRGFAVCGGGFGDQFVRAGLILQKARGPNHVDTEDDVSTAMDDVNLADACVVVAFHHSPIKRHSAKGLEAINNLPELDKVRLRAFCREWNVQVILHGHLHHQSLRVMSLWEPGEENFGEEEEPLVLVVDAGNCNHMGPNRASITDIVFEGSTVALVEVRIWNGEEGDDGRFILAEPVHVDEFLQGAREKRQEERLKKSRGRRRRN